MSDRYLRSLRLYSKEAQERISNSLVIVLVRLIGELAAGVECAKTCVLAGFRRVVLHVIKEADDTKRGATQTGMHVDATVSIHLNMIENLQRMNPNVQVVCDVAPDCTYAPNVWSDKRSSLHTFLHGVSEQVCLVTEMSLRSQLGHLGTTLKSLCKEEQKLRFAVFELDSSSLGCALTLQSSPSAHVVLGSYDPVTRSRVVVNTKLCSEILASPYFQTLDPSTARVEESIIEDRRIEKSIMEDRRILDEFVFKSKPKKDNSTVVSQLVCPHRLLLNLPSALKSFNSSFNRLPLPHLSRLNFVESRADAESIESFKAVYRRVAQYELNWIKERLSQSVEVDIRPEELEELSVNQWLCQVVKTDSVELAVDGPESGSTGSIPTKSDLVRESPRDFVRESHRDSLARQLMGKMIGAIVGFECVKRASKYFDPIPDRFAYSRSITREKRRDLDNQS